MCGVCGPVHEHMLDLLLGSHGQQWCKTYKISIVDPNLVYYYGYRNHQKLNHILKSNPNGKIYINKNHIKILNVALDWLTKSIIIEPITENYIYILLIELSK